MLYTMEYIKKVGMKLIQVPDLLELLQLNKTHNYK